MAVSVAVCLFLKKCGLENAKIKWPNDILTDREKICGILIENSIQDEKIQHSIIGIGVNINQHEFQAARATSLCRQTGKEHDLNEVLQILLSELESVYLQLRAGNNEWLKSMYLQHLYGRNELLLFESQGERFEGVIKGIDEIGRLVIDRSTTQSVYAMKEVTFIF